MEGWEENRGRMEGKGCKDGRKTMEGWEGKGGMERMEGRELFLSSIHCSITLICIVYAADRCIFKVLKGTVSWCVWYIDVIQVELGSFCPWFQ